MSKDSEIDGENPNVCFWCGNEISTFDQISRTVCRKCYRQLINAGISDDEIFQIEKTENFQPI